MKHFRMPLAVLAVLFLALAGCGKKVDPNLVRVTVFTADTFLIKIMLEAAKEVEKADPSLKIQLDPVSYNDYQNKLTAQFAAGTAPDVIAVEVSNFADMQLRDLLVDLRPFIEKDGLDLKAFYPAILERLSPGGGVYAIPSDIAPLGIMYYNKRMFREAGLEYPKSSWKWKDFLAAAKAVLKKDDQGRTVQWGYADAYGINYELFMFSNGGYYTDRVMFPTKLILDAPEVMEAIQFRWDLVYKHQVSPSLVQMANYSFGSGVEDMFLNEHVAMMASGIWHTPRFISKKELDFDIVEFPGGPRGSRGWGSGGTGFAISRDSKDPERAWKVLKALTGEGITKKIASTGMIQPALMRIADSDAFLKSPGPKNKKILLGMPKHVKFGPYMRGWVEVQDRLRALFDPMWNGKKTPDEVVPKAVKELNEIFFSKEKK